MSREIDDQAAKWAAKLDAGQIAPEEQAALDAWLAADARHLGAFGKARGLSLFSERARVLGPNFDAAKFGAAASFRPSRRHLIAGGSIGIAASLSAIILGPQLLGWGERVYRTRLGETRVVVLEDGSVMTLNTDSKVAVRYTKDLRAIELYRGEALFDVAKNRRRPFVVRAGNTQVRAVGTSFTVKRLPDQPVQVLVREGVVEIDRPGGPAVSTPVQASANTRAVVPENAPVTARAVPVAEVDRALVWRVGRVAFEGETLEEAAAIFAQYSSTKIVMDDPEVARRTITGLFVSNDPVGFSKAVAVALNLHMEVRGDEIHLSR